MKSPLSPQVLEQIKDSTEPVVPLAHRLGVSPATITKYRPTRRKHITDLEFDSILGEWLARIPTEDTAKRYGVERGTIYRVRRRAIEILRERP